MLFPLGWLTACGELGVRRPGSSPCLAGCDIVQIASLLRSPFTHLLHNTEKCGDGGNVFHGLQAGNAFKSQADNMVKEVARWALGQTGVAALPLKGAAVTQLQPQIPCCVGFSPRNAGFYVQCPHYYMLATRSVF